MIVAYEMLFYWKLANTDTCGFYKVRSDLTLSEFLEYADTVIRDKLQITDSCFITVVEVQDGIFNTIHPNNEVTLHQLYGTTYQSTTPTFYVLPG